MPMFVLEQMVPLIIIRLGLKVALTLGKYENPEKNVRARWNDMKSLQSVRLERPYQKQEISSRHSL